MTSASDGHALLRAILLDPSDDLPRLAYADWCEEAGDERRAVFVREQLRGGVAFGPFSSLYDVFARELESVLPPRAYRSGFAADLHGDGRCYWRFGVPPVEYKARPRIHHEFKAKWRRGFVDTVFTASEVWEACAAAVCASCPVETVVLYDTVRHVEREPGFDSWRADADVFGVEGWFEVQEYAMAAASLAAVNHGRRLAGLPPLPEKKP